jgi:hypothetical protein
LKDDVYSERNIIFTYKEHWLQSKKTKTKMHLLGEWKWISVVAFLQNKRVALCVYIQVAVLPL